MDKPSIYKKLLSLTITIIFIIVIFTRIVDGRYDQGEIYTLDNEANRGILQGNIDLSYDAGDVPSTIRPETDTVRVLIYVNYYVSGPGARFLLPFISPTVSIGLTMGEYPEWMSANLSTDIVYPKLSTELVETPEEVILTISLKPTAPAYITESCEVTAEAQTVKGRFGLLTFVRSATNKIPVEIKPGYYSNFRYEHQTSIEMGPNETTSIPIKITSYANARSRILFEILDIPEGWETSINPELFVGTNALGEEATGTVDFVIRSPKVDGYINEVQSFRVKVVTMAAGHPEAGIDNTTTLSFTIRCQGYGDESNSEEINLPGIEILSAIAIIVIILLVLFIVWRRKYKK